MKPLVVLLLLALAGATGCGRTNQPCQTCAEVPGGSGSSAGGGGTPSLAGAGSGGQAHGGENPFTECGPSAPSTPLTRWSALDLEWTLDDVLGPGQSFADQEVVEDSGLRAYRELTGRFVIALARVAQARAAVAPISTEDLLICEAEVADRAHCVDTWIRERGLRLYRRPLSDAQVDGYLAQFNAQSERDSPLTAAQAVLVSMVLSPYFVFRIELGQDLPKALGASPPNQPAPILLPQGTPVTAYEIAARLSHFATRRAPEPWLLASAAAGDLRSPQRRLEALERMQQSPQAQYARVLQHLEWLGLETFSAAQVDDDEALAQAMLDQTRTFIAQLLAQPRAPLIELLTSSRQPLNDLLAQHYGVDAQPGEVFAPVDLDPQLYAGVLGQGALLSRASSPTRRGVFVWGRLLCVDPPPPPAVPFQELVFVGETPRERISSVTQNQPCSLCHGLFDPAGFALEAFDDRGRLTGFDTSGALKLPSDTLTEIPVENPAELGRAIAGSADGRHCAAQRYFEQLLDRPAQGEDDKLWIECLASALDSDFDLNHLARVVVASAAVERMVREPSTVVAASSSIEPVEHALDETTQLMQAFSEDERAMLEQYLLALRELELQWPLQ